MKKLALIGNGCGVLSENRGSYIDTFETVIRLGSYKLEGFENFVGTRTDYCITAHWKLDFSKLETVKTFVTFPVFNDYYDDVKIESIKSEIVSKLNERQRNNLVHFMNRQDALDIMGSYKELGPVNINLSLINPSLGYRAIRLVIKHFPSYEIHTHGFDFFKTGWYWKQDHNRDIKNRHPYSYERALYSLLEKNGRIKFL
jgi:hypothetical protein